MALTRDQLEGLLARLERELADFDADPMNDGRDLVYDDDGRVIGIIDRFGPSPAAVRADMVAKIAEVRAALEQKEGKA